MFIHSDPVQNSASMHSEVHSSQLSAQIEIKMTNIGNLLTIVLANYRPTQRLIVDSWVRQVGLACAPTKMPEKCDHFLIVSYA